jgi:hypothetical protein
LKTQSTQIPKRCRWFAKDFRNVSVAYKSFGDTSPFRWEVQLRDPPSYLGTVELTAPEIFLAQPVKRKLLRLKFLRILEETGHDQQLVDGLQRREKGEGVAFCAGCIPWLSVLNEGPMVAKLLLHPSIGDKPWPMFLPPQRLP